MDRLEKFKNVALECYGLAIASTGTQAGRAAGGTITLVAPRARDFMLVVGRFEIFETKHSIRRFGLAALVGLGYLPLAGMEMLPTKTAAQERLVTFAALAVLFLFGTLFVTMARLARKRRRVHAEFKSRLAPEPPLPDEPVE
jgi:hypothetical protein